MWRFKWFLLLFLVLIILAFTFLPWYVLVGLAVVMVFSAKYVVKWIFYRLFMMPFKAKGAVLHDATAVVLSLEPSAVPVPPQVERLEHKDLSDADEEEFPPPPDEPPRDYYRLEVTITPKPKVGGFQHWEPGELLLVLPDTKPMTGADDNACSIEGLEIKENGRYVADEGFKPAGEQTLRLLIGVQPGTRRLVFQYYFEKFGEVVLPGPDVLTTAITAGPSV